VTQDGVGLGLHLANVFTKLHGGKLVLESEFGVGTTVALHFPAALFNIP